MYTIRWVGLYPCPITGDMDICVKVSGISRDGCSCFWCLAHPDMPYRADRFRPLVECKTDISIFTEMLKTKDKELIE